jgi:hypothetical protein
VLLPVVTAAAPLLIWGWRLPFLFAILTAAVGLLLRFNMPEVGSV